MQVLRIRHAQMHILAGLEPACPSVRDAAKYCVSVPPFRHRCERRHDCQLALCCQLFADLSAVLQGQCRPQLVQYALAKSIRKPRCVAGDCSKHDASDDRVSRFAGVRRHTGKRLGSTEHVICCNAARAHSGPNWVKAANGEAAKRKNTHARCERENFQFASRSRLDPDAADRLWAGRWP